MYLIVVVCSLYMYVCSGMFIGSCVPRKVKTSSLNVTSDSYDEFVSSGSTSGVARRQRLMSDNHRPERLECHKVDQ